MSTPIERDLVSAGTTDSFDMTPISLSSAATTIATETRPAWNGDRPSPVLADLAEAAGRFLQSGADADRAQIRGLAAALADQGIGPADCAAAVWGKASPLLLAAAERDRAPLLERVAAAQDELWRLFERSYRIEERAHRRIAEACTRRNIEIDLILDHLPAYAFAKDAQSRYTAANQSFCEALGLSRERILSHTDDELFPDDIAAALRARDREVLESKEALRHEGRVELGGQERILLITKAPLLDAEGKATGLFGVGLDITQHKLMKQRELELDTALESSHDAILIMDAARTISYVNSAFERLTQFKGEEVVGQKDTLFRSSPLDTAGYDQMWSQLADGRAWHGVVTNRRKDGSLFESEQDVVPVRDENGAASGFVLVARDISEQKRLMEALQQAVMVKSDFTSMISHELRTPLCAIKEAVDVMADGSAGPTNDHQTQFLGLAKRNVDRLHRLINDVLDFSCMERGTIQASIQPCSLNDLVSEVSHQQQSAAQRRGIELTLDLDPAVGNVPLDPNRIRQILLNLHGNAVRYCTGPWIRVSTLKRADEVVVTVRDSGPGIEPEHLQSIFNPFVQLSSGLGRQVGGTGLGLAICRQIMELHGGRIWVESKLHEGSAFSFALPLGPKEDNASYDEDPAR